MTPMIKFYLSGFLFSMKSFFLVEFQYYAIRSHSRHTYTRARLKPYNGQWNVQSSLRPLNLILEKLATETVGVNCITVDARNSLSIGRQNSIIVFSFSSRKNKMKVTYFNLNLYLKVICAGFIKADDETKLRIIRK